MRTAPGSSSASSASGASIPRRSSPSLAPWPRAWTKSRSPKPFSSRLSPQIGGRSSTTATCTTAQPTATTGRRFSALVSRTRNSARKSSISSSPNPSRSRAGPSLALENRRPLLGEGSRPLLGIFCLTDCPAHGGRQPHCLGCRHVALALRQFQHRANRQRRIARHLPGDSQRRRQEFFRGSHPADDAERTRRLGVDPFAGEQHVVRERALDGPRQLHWRAREREEAERDLRKPEGCCL